MVGVETAYKLEFCNRCHGTGRRYGKKCEICHGIGKVAVKQPPEKCPACHGTGYYCGLGEKAYHGRCPHCKGSGWRQTLYPLKA